MAARLRSLRCDEAAGWTDSRLSYLHALERVRECVGQTWVTRLQGSRGLMGPEGRKGSEEGKREGKEVKEERVKERM